MPLRAVIDTNTWIGGLLSGSGPPARIVDAWLDHRFTLVTSIYLIQELLHVLTYPRIASRLRLSDDEVAIWVTTLAERAELVPGNLHLPGVTRDVKDDAVVACAVEGAVDCLVSGDRDLLDLGSVHGIAMLTPRQFIQRLAENEP